MPPLLRPSDETRLYSERGDSRYIPNVILLIRQHRILFFTGMLGGLALRIVFFIHFPAVTDDSHIYADLATNWLQHGVYGQTVSGPPPSADGQPDQPAQRQIMPTAGRLPGYPAFLVLIFWLFGVGNFKAVMLTQILFDLATCVIVADLARRAVSERASEIAFLLATFCPFLANYSSAVLTETLEVFFTALALDCALAASSRMREGWLSGGVTGLWAATGAAISACVLLRPDGGLLLAAVLIYLLYVAMSTAKGAFLPAEIRALFKQYPDNPQMPPAMKFVFWHNSGAALLIMLIVTAFALAPLVPWTVRNWHTLHRFQPLAPRYANDADELVPRGFNRWVKTWILDYASVEEIYWNVPGDKIDPRKLPSRALENAPERDSTLALIADYNQDQDLTPELDARFDRLAEDRIHEHPSRYYLVLPMLRVTDMWLRPRTELLPVDPRWWTLNDETKRSITAVGFGLLNLAYVCAALLALIRKTPAIHGLVLLAGFVLLRSALLLTIESPEPRYTLECYPVVIICAAACLAKINRAASKI